MGCGGSVPVITPDQNGNVHASKPPSRQQASPPKQPTPPPPPKEPTPPPPKEPTPPPPKEPTPPPPKQPTPPPPKQPTPPPPKQPTPPPPKEPTPPPPPKEPTPPPQETLQESTKPDEDSKLTPKVLEEFIDIEKQLQDLQKLKAEEKLMLYELELKHTEGSIKVKETELSEAKDKALKEYQDIANFNVQTFMISNQIAYLSKEQVEEARNKEEQEYLEAKNKEDICEKELEKLKMQLLKIKDKLDTMKSQVDTLVTLQDKQDGLLENIFNGDYGSELEDKLEAEAEILMQKKQKISGIHMTWVSSRELISMSCAQLVFSISRWNQISQHPEISKQGKFIMVTETRNHMISAHMNMRRAADLLKVNLPYWSVKDDQNMVMSINLVYNDVRGNVTFNRALAWYKYYHWRFVLLFNWMQQVLNTRISVDAANIDKEYKQKYQLLKMERLRCIKEIVKEKLDIDLDIEQFRQVTAEEEKQEADNNNMFELADNPDDDNAHFNKADDLPAAVEQQADPTSLDAVKEEEEEKPKEVTEKKTEEEKSDEKSEENPEGELEKTTLENEEPVKTEEPGPATQETTENGTKGAPQIKAIPLGELAPLPSAEELFGEVEKLMDDAEKGEEILEMNKLRQEQELQERLRKRRSRRKRIQDMENGGNDK